MRFRIEFSQEGGGPFEPLLELAAASWQLAEFDLFESSEGLLPYGYYRVWEEGERCALYHWDGQLGSFSRLDSPAGHDLPRGAGTARPSPGFYSPLGGGISK